MPRLVISRNAPKNGRLGVTPVYVAAKVSEAVTEVPFNVTEVSAVPPEPPQYRKARRLVGLAGMPLNIWVLVAPTAQLLPLLSCVRSEPPVLTKLMCPVSRSASAGACASAGRAPRLISTNARRHPMPQRPRL